MTNSTPPGWYPDPGQPDDRPLQQRWWDGSAWTDHLRPATAETWNAATAFPAHPGYAPAQPPRGRRGRRIAVSVVAGVVVVALAGGFYLLGKDSGGGGAKAAGPAPSASSQPGQGGGGQGGANGGSGGLGGDSGGLGGGDTGGGSSQGGEGQGQLPQTEPGFATDAASGIDLPVPSGWKGQSGLEGAGVTTGSYACPGAAKQTCVRGGVFSAPAAALKNTGSTAKEAAEQDIAGNAKESYGAGGIYGTITSHKELKSGAVKVAGKEGYFVRWKVVTSKGDDGYVESLAFPSPTVDGQLVLVRAGFDINSKAPSLSVLDKMVSGIKAAPASGGGSGQGV
ncbi:DUF2510 domain-containing protein [Streptomyces montanisoli]|uniref:DUF2510 domain-containing protein n=1 Tax=Streptomyces montanisoli TaxID=2798581 RepID=A0A940MDL7_9ACTN|nr:DUF2510 domain-containing protein [Streptomyces montanisoli]MBP0458045.1 DUF2510 domain-containing protein [Streptomyces montanisoli]